MFTEDFILRQISMLVAVLAKVTGLAKAGKFQEAHQSIDQAIEAVLGLDANIVRNLDHAGLLALFPSMNGLDAGKAFFLAGLLAAEGDVLVQQGQQGASRRKYEQALDLCLSLSASNPAGLEEDLPAMMEELQGKLDDKEQNLGVKRS